MLNGPVPMLRVKKMAKTLAFYRDDLSLQVLNTFGPSGKEAWACLGSPKRDQIMLYTEVAGMAGVENNHTVYYFKPEDVKGLHARLKQRGHAVSEMGVTVYGMREFYLKDPDGRQLTFGQPTDDPPDRKED